MPPLEILRIQASLSIWPSIARGDVWVEDDTAFELTVLDAARRYPFFIVACAILAGFLAFAASRTVLNEWVASSTVLIEDPASTGVFDTGSSAEPERYVAAQAAILESTDIARRVGESFGADRIDTADILDGRVIETSQDSDLIGITFANTDPDIAVAYSVEFGNTYIAYREDQTSETYQSAIAGLDNSIENVDAELTVIDEEIQAISSLPGEESLEEELQTAINDFLSAEPDTETAANSKRF